jgi:hypothetical protein
MAQGREHLAQREYSNRDLYGDAAATRGLPFGAERGNEAPVSLRVPQASIAMDHS